ncbi:hypothetical protein ACHAXR_011421 [Thalassiosira sp. AJA248-18]
MTPSTIPRLHRFLSEDHDDSSSNSSIGSDTEELLISKSSFATPLTVRESNVVFRQDTTGVTKSSYNNHRHPQPHKQQHLRHHPQSSTRASAVRNHPEPISRSEYCGLSAQISREISYRSIIKAPPTGATATSSSPSESRIATTEGCSPKERIPMNPTSRDHLIDKSSTTPLTESKVAHNTASTTNSSNGGSSPSNSPMTRMRKNFPKKLLDSPKSQLKKLKTMGRKPSLVGLSSVARKKIKKNYHNMNANETNDSSVAANDAWETSYVLGVNDYRLTSTELDPSPFQVELPVKKEITIHSKICALMDGYTAIHRDANLTVLAGMSRSTLMKEYYEKTNPKRPMISGFALACHRDIVQKLLSCADDLVVEGFFREHTTRESNNDKEEPVVIEACILSSESLRQIIVCFRGSSTATQIKPLGKNNLFGTKPASSTLHEEQKVPILTTFRSAYFGTALEKTVFALLANLATHKPFFDVVMTGHSFGAAMATIASLRYASSNPQMRVSCNVFASPRIGGDEWRQLVHSVPNLRVFRVENGSNLSVSYSPSGNERIHCGHVIQICDCVQYSTGKVGSEFKARRFDRDRSPGIFVQAKIIPMNLARGSSQSKVDHEIQSYVDKLTNSGDKWFSDFCELKGKGVSGANNERRTLA